LHFRGRRGPVDRRSLRQSCYCYVRKILEDGRELFEEEFAHPSEETGVVGVDTDEQADTCPDEEIEDKEEEDKFHLNKVRW
jgi:hypothetical protein